MKPAAANREPVARGLGRRIVHIGQVKSWPYKPTALWRRLVAVIGLGAFTAICAAALVAIVVIAAAVGALVLEAVIG